MTILNSFILRQIINLSLITLLASCSCNKKIQNESSYLIDNVLDDQELDEQELDDSSKDDQTEDDLINYESGLKCEILHSGPTSSKLPTQGQTITAHYSCWHNEANYPGQIVSSSHDHGTPVQFKIGLGEVIRAWDEALMDMRVGDKWRLYVPSELAFGTAGADQLIPGDIDLIYDIEIIEIS